MSSLRRFEAKDLFKYANVNLDPLTETYHLSFYLQYLATWPDYCTIANSPEGTAMGYIMGKAEGRNHLWHGNSSKIDKQDM
jgi:N-terminal acetyltransferase B complex catalytic subunit